MFPEKKCPCCEVLKDENKHLRGLVAQLMNQIAPKPEETLDPSLEGPKDAREQIKVGEG